VAARWWRVESGAGAVERERERERERKRERESGAVKDGSGRVTVR
jgi:hypothetical protein